MIIGIDIDGTAFTHEYPRLGRDVGAFPYLRRAQEMGARFIIFTMRDGAELTAAVEKFNEEGIEIYGANVNPTQWVWTMSPKAYCHLYVDDNALGCPLTTKPLPGGYQAERPYVNWEVAGPMLVATVRAWANEKHVKLKNGTRYAGTGKVEGVF